MSDRARRILGIDLGVKYVGLAIGDSILKIATGFDVIEYKAKADFLEVLRRVVSENEIDLVVLGLPLNMDGSEGKKAREARKFGKLFKTQLNIEVELIDEGLTTFQAINELHAVDGKVGKNRQKINMIAATIILQNYLDRLPHQIEQ
jgi:putative Holliday junction resolvase